MKPFTITHSTKPNLIERLAYGSLFSVALLAELVMMSAAVAILAVIAWELKFIVQPFSALVIYHLLK